MTKEQSVSRRLSLILVVCLLTFLADQATKYAAVTLLSVGRPVELFGGIVRLNLLYNPGMAFGLPVRGGLYIALLALFFMSALALVLIRPQKSPDEDNATGPASPTWVILASGLGLGAALGNILDRIRLGAVIDFLDLKFWPVFNLADTALTIAAVIFALCLFAGGRKHPISDQGLADKEQNL